MAGKMKPKSNPRTSKPAKPKTGGSYKKKGGKY